MSDLHLAKSALAYNYIPLVPCLRITLPFCLLMGIVSYARINFKSRAVKITSNEQTVFVCPDIQDDQCICVAINTYCSKSANHCIVANGRGIRMFLCMNLADISLLLDFFKLDNSKF